MLHIQEGVDLLPYNTFQVSCIARYFVTVHSSEDIQALIQHPLWKSQEKKLFLGGGSNMLFVSPTYDGIVVKNEIMGKVQSPPHPLFEKEEEHEYGDSPLLQRGARGDLLTVGGGENRDQFVWWTIEHGYTGVENLISIPGTVGAAPVQNIGAYGVEVESVIESVHGVDMHTGKIETYTHDACDFGYRSSIFKHVLKNDFFITHVTFKLQQYNHAHYTPLLDYGGVQERVEMIAGGASVSPHHVATAIAQIRSEKLPDWKKLGTAGSFFKNPIVDEDVYVKLEKKFGIKGRLIESLASSEQLVASSSYFKLSAGQLIDMAGLKGYRLGNIGVYENHALVLVNYGEQDGTQFIGLIGLIQQTVYDMFDVMLEPEVNVIL